MGRIMMKPQVLRVSLQMSRVSGGSNWQDPDPFKLTITDEESNLQFAEISLTPEALADLLSTRITYGKAEYRPDPRVGKTHENQTVRLPFDKGKYGDMEKVKELAKKWEADNPGWEVDEYCTDKWNSHKLKEDGYHVIARRWV